MSQILLNLFNEGDEEVYIEIYRQFYTPLINHARIKTGDLEVAEDLVQDLFVHLYFNRNIEKNIEGYLFIALKRRILNYWRHQKVKDLSQVHVVERNYSNVEDMHQKVELKEFMEDLHTQVNYLPPQCQKVFKLKRADYSNKEIATHLNISIKTVEAHFTKALSYLRSNLEYPLLLYIYMGTDFLVV